MSKKLVVVTTGEEVKTVSAPKSIRPKQEVAKLDFEQFAADAAAMEGDDKFSAETRVIGSEVLNFVNAFKHVAENAKPRPKEAGIKQAEHDLGNVGSVIKGFLGF